MKITSASESDIEEIIQAVICRQVREYGEIEFENDEEDVSALLGTTRAN